MVVVNAATPLTL